MDWDMCAIPSATSSGNKAPSRAGLVPAGSSELQNTPGTVHWGDGKSRKTISLLGCQNSKRFLTKANASVLSGGNLVTLSPS